jgi:hypothetical protein
MSPLRRSGCGCIYDVKEKGSMFRQNRVVLLSYNYFRKEKKMFLNWVLILYEISPYIAHALRYSVHINDRMPGRGRFMDRSRLKVGRQSLPNRIGPLFAKISFDWAGISLSDNALRRLLKSKFFKYFN